MKSEIFEPDRFESAGQQLHRFLNCHSTISVFKIIEEDCKYWVANEQTNKDGKRLILLYEEK